MKTPLLLLSILGLALSGCATHEKCPAGAAASKMACCSKDQKCPMGPDAKCCAKEKKAP